MVDFNQNKRTIQLLETCEHIKKEEEKTNDSLLKEKKYFAQLKNELKDIENMKQYIKNNQNLECFELSDYIGSGNESLIYRGSLISKQKPEHKKNAIIKVILSKKRNDKEIKISSTLKNKNIINDYGHYTLKQNESTLLLMEMAEYQNLEVFQKAIIKKQILTESFINFITYQILNGLNYLHSCRIAHMDLKPQHLVLNEDLEVKIIDFSSAINYKCYNHYNGNIRLPFCGTNFYISKEVIKGDSIKVKDLNKIDLYALGVIIFKLAFGKYPYGLEDMDKNDSKEILRKIENEELEMEKEMNYSPSFMDFLSKLLEKNINKRINIQGALNHYWIKGSQLLLEEKEKLGNTSSFLNYLLADHIKIFNDYVKAQFYDRK